MLYPNKTNETIRASRADRRGGGVTGEPGDGNHHRSVCCGGGNGGGLRVQFGEELGLGGVINTPIT